MHQLKTKCDHCGKTLAPNEWSTEAHYVYCSEKCTESAEENMRIKFERQFANR